MRHFWPIFFLLPCTLTPLCAQQDNEEQPAALLTIHARTVIEDVVVLDKNGHAVPGLRKEDFQIFDNGKQQAITFLEPNFVAADDPVAPPSLPENTFTNVPLADAHNVTNVLLLDALDTRSTERMYAQVQMIKYLASLPPNMRIAVFTLDNERFHLIWGFNQDSSALRSSIARFTAKRPGSKASSAETQREAEREELVQSVDAVKQAARQAGDDRLGESADALRHFLKSGTGIVYEYGHAITTWNAFEALGQYLAGIPGRKNLFWLAGTFPHCFKTDACFEDYRRAREKLTEAQVSVYPIDANGVDVDSGGVLPPNMMPESVLRYEDTEGWAEETGGKAYHANDLSSEIADAADHGSRYYTLAYVPTDTREDGRERKVEVRVTSGNYTISYRRRYLEQTPKEIAKAGAKPASSPLIPLMGHGLPNASELPYRLKVVPAALQPASITKLAGQNSQLAGKLTRYDLEFELDAGNLSLRPDIDGERRKSLQVALVVYGPDFKPLNWEIRDIHLHITQEQWTRHQNSGIPVHLEIDVPAGDVSLRTGIYDPATSKVGTLEIPLSILTPGQK